MKRRTAIRHVVLLSAGAALLDSCQSKETSAYQNIPLTEGQEDMLGALTETIIPTTDFIGAKDLKSHEFVLMMVDDCASPEDQKKFLDGMKQFDEACNKLASSAFAQCTPAKRIEFLTAVEQKENNELPEDAKRFYRAVKRYTIQSFTSSEKFLTEVRHYSQIPPKFKGCVAVNAA